MMYMVFLILARALPGSVISRFQVSHPLLAMLRRQNFNLLLLSLPGASYFLKVYHKAPTHWRFAFYVQDSSSDKCSSVQLSFEASV
jgi:hypothetical protein